VLAGDSGNWGLLQYKRAIVSQTIEKPDGSTGVKTSGPFTHFSYDDRTWQIRFGEVQEIHLEKRWPGDKKALQGPK